MGNVAIDFDGTIVAKAWPNVGAPLPGAVEAIKKIQSAGHRVFVYTVRTSPVDWNGQPREPGQVFHQEQVVRSALDDMGLEDVAIWHGAGKPAYHLLIDDRAMWFPGRPGSWRATADKVLIRLGGPE